MQTPSKGGRTETATEQRSIEWKHRWREETAWTANELAKLCCGWNPDSLEIPEPTAFERAKERILRAARVGDLRPADVHMVPPTREELFYGEGTFFRPRDVGTWAAKQFSEFPYTETDWTDTAPHVTVATLTTAAATTTTLRVDDAFRSKAESSAPAKREATLQQRAEWIQREKQRVGLKALGIDRKTYKKIVACNEVTEPTLHKIAEHLKVQREEIPGPPLI